MIWSRLQPILRGRKRANNRGMQANLQRYIRLQKRYLTALRARRQQSFFGPKDAIGGGRPDAPFAVTLTIQETMLPTMTSIHNGLMQNRN